VDEFELAYFTAALWSSTDDDGEPLEAKYSIEDIAPETRREMLADTDSFIDRFVELIEDDDPKGLDRWNRWDLAGHDFWLTRNGHGAGFWEPGAWPKHGDELSKGAEAYGECSLYVGDDGRIYGEGCGRPPRARAARTYVTPRARGAHRRPSPQRRSRI
jgi:hypothetical protein